MNAQAIILFAIVIFLIASGLLPCWRSNLQFGMKLFWSVIILVLPGVGTLFYFGYKDQLNELQ